MSVGYVSYAAPLATTAASLGVTAQPTTTGTGTTGGNAAVATGYDPTPATTTGGGASATTLPQYAQAAAAANNTSVANVNAATNLVQNQFGTTMANQFATASGGGAIGDALKSGVSSIVAFAQKGMADIQKAIQGDMAANNGEVDPAKMQLYTMKMSTYELLNQMAAKIQEKQDRAVQIWLQ
ncbi:MAG: hypothetical protein KDC46_06670 [Thermoleophilia bacterium]|nr:hypothetical protein [Thermoleophilia bacterium]